MMSMDILGLCDRLVGEVGRRQHRFAWLIVPGAGPGEWFPVDAYYPGRRLVVVLDAAQAPAEMCTELMPRHGLHLLLLSAGELGADHGAAEPVLRGMLQALKLPEHRTVTSEPAPRPPVRLEDAFARVAASFAHAAAPAPPSRPSRPLQAAAAQRAARVVAARTLAPPRPRPVRPLPRRSTGTAASRLPRPVAARTDPGAPALGLGLVLSAIVAAELYLGVARLGLNAGLWGLALGLAIDSCARLLGTVAARRVGASRAAWTCAIAGSPGVAAFTLFAAEGPVAVEPAPLAGLLSILATLLAGGALLARLLGI